MESIDGINAAVANTRKKSTGKNRGPPRSGSDGFELFDEQNMGEMQWPVWVRDYKNLHARCVTLAEERP
jgi:hypothetical protein